MSHPTGTLRDHAVGAPSDSTYSDLQNPGRRAIMRCMATAGLFGRVIAAIEAVLGPDVPVEQIAITALPDGRLRVDLTTPAPGRIIGRRGTSGDALRARLAEELEAEVELNIIEAHGEGSPGEEPPLEPPSGVREPRRPRPGGPAASEALPLPTRPEGTSPPFTGKPIPPPSGERQESRPQRRGAA